MSIDIQATVKTPHIKVDSSGGQILLAGISIPEDPHEFYAPLNEEIDVYAQQPAEKTKLEFMLEYFNTSSTLIIRNLIRRLGTLASKTDLQIIWYYEKDDEDMYEAGEEFRLLFPELKFDLVGLDELPDRH